MDFYKYQGAGNDFVIIDNMDLHAGDKTALAAALCDRHFGVGADGFIAAEPSEIADVKMAFYNADGSIAGMCGNGVRCFAKFVSDNGIVEGNTFSAETGDGIKILEILDSNERESIVRVNMGKLGEISELTVPVDGEKIRCSAEDLIEELPVAFTHLGVPHAVIIREMEEPSMEVLDELALTYGDYAEHAPAFGEAHTNVNFITVADEEHILCSTWERGAGKTLACGTGACSSAAAARKLRGCGDAVRVTMPGGEVVVSFEGDDVYMKGSAVLTFVGNAPQY